MFRMGDLQSWIDTINDLRDKLVEAESKAAAQAQDNERPGESSQERMASLNAQVGAAQSVHTGWRQRRGGGREEMRGIKYLERPLLNRNLDSHLGLGKGGGG